MLKYNQIILALAMLGTLTGPALAQNGARREGQVDHVQDNQQSRIGQGVTAGSLTAGESTRLERNQASINRETNRLQSDGHFTPHDQRLIDRRQDRQNHVIYRLKHNGRHQ